jgi:hypothetical protein
VTVTVKIHGLEVAVDSLDDLDELIRRYSPAAVQSTAAEVPPHEPPPPAQPASEPRPADFRGARVAKGGVKIPSATKKDAMLKLYKGLKATTHHAILRYLALKGANQVDVEEVRRDLKLHDRFKMSGFTAAIRRRAPSYGLTGDEVLDVEFKGVVAGKRIYLYKLGSEMLEMMQEEGFVSSHPKFASLSLSKMTEEEP